MNELGIVISRYYEDLKWVEEIKSFVDVSIYHTKGDIPIMENHQTVPWSYPRSAENNLGNLNIEKCLKNNINLDIIDIPDDLGFEVSTYLHHLYTKYDSLNEITVYLQAHPHIYIKNIVPLLNDPNKLAHTQFAPSDPSSRELNPSKLIINMDEYINFSFISDNFAWGKPYTDYCTSPYKNDFTKAPWWFIWEKEKLNFFEGRSFGAGNQFMVNKKSVLKNEQNFYKKVQEFSKTYMDPNPDSVRPSCEQRNQGPNVLEQSWSYIFQ